MHFIPWSVHSFVDLYHLTTLYWFVHDDVNKWKPFPRYWLFVRGFQWSPVNSPHRGQRRGALMFSLICAWINRWINNGEAGDLRRYRAYYDVIVMCGYCGTFWYRHQIFYCIPCRFMQHLPFRFSADHIVMELSLRISDQNFVSLNFTFFDCDFHDSWVPIRCWNEIYDKPNYGLTW